MSRWLWHHVDLVFLIGFVGVAAALAYALGRMWWLLVPAPAFLAAWAWFGWEYSSEAAPLIVVITVAGYAGLALGAGLRHARCGRHARPA